MKPKIKKKSSDEINKFLTAVAETWEKYPEMRFGQLVDNAMNCDVDKHQHTFYIEDVEMLKKIRKFGRERSLVK